LKIEDYALIGDCHSAALVGRNGSIDWLCWPRFDSAACFAALLGDRQHGHWKISPASTILSVKRRYRDDSLILETDFETAEGAVTLVDFMPIRTVQCDLVRMVVGRRGRVAMDMDFVLRFDYGFSVPWITRLPDHTGINAVAGPDRVLLRTPDAEQAAALLDGRVDVREGDRLVVRAPDAAELNARLVGAGLRVEEVVRERRSLEDLVMNVTGPSADRIDGPASGRSARPDGSRVEPGTATPDGAATADGTTAPDGEPTPDVTTAQDAS